MKRVFTALRALYKYLVWRKCARVFPEVKQARMGECLGCEFVTWNHTWLSFMRFKCEICGCYLRLKTWCIDEKCPLEKW